MFNRKKKTVKFKDDLNIKFTIPQLYSTDEGLRKNISGFKRSEFASSLYGTGIKDVATYHDNALEGIDVKRSYDSFRDDKDKKLRDEDYLKRYGTKYPEFYQINKNTAREVYGEDIVLNKNKKEVGSEKLQTFTFFKSINESKKETEIYQSYVEAKEEELSNKLEVDDESDVKFNFGFEEEDFISLKPSIQLDDNQNEKEEIKAPTRNEPLIIRRTEEEKREVRNNFVVPDEEATLSLNEEASSNEESALPQVAQNKYLNYKLPSIDNFSKTPYEQLEEPAWVEQKAQILDDLFERFGIDGHVVSHTVGPTFTRYEVGLELGTNFKKIPSIQDSIQGALGVRSIRIQAPIPGKTVVGIEVPNDTAQMVRYGDLLSEEFITENKPLKVVLGKDIDGRIVSTDIAKWPHGLVSGSTGSGKSVCINTILVGLLLKNKPQDLKLILIDPKQVELNTYDELPHLITPVISDPEMASASLAWSVEEMERRYTTFKETRTKSIVDYNEKALNDYSLKKMPYIVVVIDELADLMQVCGQDVEANIQRITQKARAAGIHLILATQRPTVDVIKGTIKANIPTRLAFRVVSTQDSLTILDEVGAEQLLGRGDMLIKQEETPNRLQGAFMPDSEIDYVTDFIRSQAGPDYIFEHSDLKKKFQSEQFAGSTSKDENSQTLYEVARFVLEQGSCSTNKIQNKFNFGYNRASNIVNILEDMGIVGPNTGTKPREILVDPIGLQNIFERED